MKILWNLLCQYNNIYAGSYKYLKEKKSTNERPKKKNKKKNFVAIVATLPLEQTKSKEVLHIHLTSVIIFSQKIYF